MTRNQDISFGAGSPIVDDAQSPVLTCRSSFSSFRLEPSTPCFASGVFSFHSSSGSNTLEFATSISSMPSFAFFSPGSESVQANCPLNFSANIPRVDSVQGNVVSNVVQYFLFWLSSVFSWQYRKLVWGTGFGTIYKSNPIFWKHQKDTLSILFGIEFVFCFHFPQNTQRLFGELFCKKILYLLKLFENSGLSEKAMKIQSKIFLLLCSGKLREAVDLTRLFSLLWTWRERNM